MPHPAQQQLCAAVYQHPVPTARRSADEGGVIHFDLVTAECINSLVLTPLPDGAVVANVISFARSSGPRRTGLVGALAWASFSDTTGNPSMRVRLSQL